MSQCTRIRGECGRMTARLLVVAIATAAPILAMGQTGDEWLGMQVVTKYGAVLRDSPPAGDDAKPEKPERGKPQSKSRLYLVVQANGPWLRIRDEANGAAAWITAEWLVPYDQAIDYFTNEIRTNPNNADAYYNRGGAWVDKQEYDKAIDDYSQAVRLNPKHAYAYVGRGCAWFDKQEYDKAIDDCSEAVRLNPKNADAYYNRGCAWCEKQEYDKAIDDFSQAVRLNPNDAYAFDGRARLWAACPDDKIRDGERAVESAKTACELTDNQEAAKLDTLAAAQAEAGDFDAAVKTQETAIGLLTDDEAKKDFTTRLDLYRARKPYRLSP